MNSDKRNIIQKSIHSKATQVYYKANYACNNTGANNHRNTGANSHRNSGSNAHRNSGSNSHRNSGYSNYYSYGCYNHSNTGSCNWGVWYDAWGNCSHSAGGYDRCGNNHGNGGCGNHTNSGYNNHTNSGYSNHSNSGYSNHTNTGYSNHTNQGYSNTIVAYTNTVDTLTRHPKKTADAVTLSKLFVNNVKIPTIQCRWSAASGSVTQIVPDFSKFDQTCTAARFYLQTSTTKDFTNSNFTLLGEVNASSSVYNWTVSGLATDASSLYCRIAVTAYNGSWSALLSNGQLNVQDSREQMTSGGTNPKITVTAFTDIGASYMISKTFKIFFYKPPMYNPDTGTWSSTQISWKTDPWQKETTDQVEAEINKALGKFDEATYVFSDRPIVDNFTFVKASHAIEQINAMSTISDATSVSLPSSPANSSFVTDNVLSTLQDMLDTLEGK